MLPGFTTSPARFNEGTPAQVSLALVDVGTVSPSAQTSITLSALGIGTAQADRIVYLPVAAESTGFHTNVASIAIGGRPAIQGHISFNTDPAPDQVVAIWYAYVPTGTTADVVFNFNASTSTTIYVASFRAVNVTVPVFATANNATTAGTSIDTTLNIPALGAALALGIDAHDSSSHTWSGLTERTDNDPGSYTVGTASNEVPAGDSARNITFTGGFGTAKCLVAISIR